MLTTSLDNIGNIRFTGFICICWLKSHFTACPQKI